MLANTIARHHTWPQSKEHHGKEHYVQQHHGKEHVNNQQQDSQHHAPAARARPGYGGPERRTPGRNPAICLMGMLDEIDYGMLLVGPDGHVSYMNHAARLELDDLHPLLLKGQALCTLHSQDAAPLQDALSAAQRGLRRLLTLGQTSHRVSVSVVPLGTAGTASAASDGSTASASAARTTSADSAAWAVRADSAESAVRADSAERPASTAAGASSAASPSSATPGVATLLVLGKRQVCENLSVQGFARSVHLTPAETRVLEGLCKGTRPIEIAKRAGVAVSTVRTQIGSIRAKTGAASIRDLVQQVAVLPPLVGALRNGAALGGFAVDMADLGSAMASGGSRTAQ